MVELLERARPRDAGTFQAAVLPTVIAADHLSFSYASPDGQVLHDLTATFSPGEVTALTGPNGSGKSTLLALMLGLVTPSAGSVLIGGDDLRLIDLEAFRRRVGYLSQRPFLPERASARDAMRLLAPDADDALFRRTLERVALWPVLVARCPTDPLDAKVGSLSAGEKQRLALARVLARDAAVLLLDEPDANLDADGLELVAGLLRELARGRVVVLAAHSARLVRAADKVLSLVPKGALDETKPALDTDLKGGARLDTRS